MFSCDVGVQLSENLSWFHGDTVLIFAGPIFGCADLFAVRTDLCCNWSWFAVFRGGCTGMQYEAIYLTACPSNTAGSVTCLRVLGAAVVLL